MDGHAAHGSGARRSASGFALLGVAAFLALGPQQGRAAVTNGLLSFNSDRDGTHDIFTMTAQGGAQAPLATSAGADASADWSPDGTKVVFQSDRDGDNEIFVINADGTGVMQLTDNAASDRHPDWSPDGTRIAFHTDRSGPGEIYLMNADGSNEAPPAAATAEGGMAAWSPDGSRIAYERDFGGDNEIRVMNADGSGQADLTSNATGDTGPTWSPDGSRIAFEASRDGNLEIYVMSSDGSNQTNLTANGATDVHPSWSPDGAKIAFASTRDGNAEIHVMNVDGSGVANLSNNAGTDMYPGWQPIITADPPASGPQQPVAAPEPSLTLEGDGLQTSTRKTLTRRELYEKIVRGFGGSQSGFSRIEAYLVRASRPRSAAASSNATASKRCYRVHRPNGPVPCSIRTTNGVTMASAGDVLYKPFGSGSRGKRALRRLKRGKALLTGFYRLEFNAYVDPGGSPRAYTYYLKVTA